MVEQDCFVELNLNLQLRHKQELDMVPGRDLGVLLKWKEGEMGARGKAGSPEIVVQSEERNMGLRSIREMDREDSGAMLRVGA